MKKILFLLLTFIFIAYSADSFARQVKKKAQEPKETFVIDSKLNDEDREKVRRAYHDLRNFCKVLMLDYWQDIKSISATYNDKCSHCERLDWGGVAVFQVTMNEKLSLRVPKGQGFEGHRARYDVGEGGLLIFNENDQNLCGLRNSMPMTMYLKFDGTVEYMD